MQIYPRKIQEESAGTLILKVACFRSFFKNINITSINSKEYRAVNYNNPKP